MWGKNQSDIQQSKKRNPPRKRGENPRKEEKGTGEMQGKKQKKLGQKTRNGKN